MNFHSQPSHFWTSSTGHSTCCSLIQWYHCFSLVSWQYREYVDLWDTHSADLYSTKIYWVPLCAQHFMFQSGWTTCHSSHILPFLVFILLFVPTPQPGLLPFITSSHVSLFTSCPFIKVQLKCVFILKTTFYFFQQEVIFPLFMPSKTVSVPSNVIWRVQYKMKMKCPLLKI